jgi:hypothetical protein
MSVQFFSLHLSLAVHLGHVQAPKAHSLGVFTSVVVIVCVGALVVTIQAKVSTGQFCTCVFSSLMLLQLLGGRVYVSFESRWLISGIEEYAQVILPRTVRPWLLRRPIGHCRSGLLLCSHHLCPCSHSHSCMGLVYMG